MTEAEVVHEVAILLIAADSVAGEDFSRGEDAVVWARGYAESSLEKDLWKDGQHSGDCTMQPHTCVRCTVEEAEDRARELIGT